MTRIIGITLTLLCGLSYAADWAGAAVQSPDLLYRSKCAVCHRVYPPKEHTFKKFQVYIAKYGRKLSDEERSVLSSYLKANAKEE